MFSNVPTGATMVGTRKVTDLRYRWKKTWPDAEDDFVGIDGEMRFARIYKNQHGPQAGTWFWSMTLEDGRRGNGEMDGICPSARLAAAACEAAYDTAYGRS